MIASTMILFRFTDEWLGITGWGYVLFLMILWTALRRNH